MGKHKKKNAKKNHEIKKTNQEDQTRKRGKKKRTKLAKS